MFLASEALKNPVNSAAQQQHPPPSLLDQELESTPANYNREGEDWFAIFNKDVPRQLDIRLLHTFKHYSDVHCLRFSNDGRYIATGCNRTAQIFDVETGHEVVTLNNAPAEHEGNFFIRSVCFSPDGQYLAVGSLGDKVIRLWDIARTTISTIFAGHMAGVFSLDISRDGRRLASGSEDRTARLWDLETGQCLLTLSIESMIFSVAISPDRKFLAAGSVDPRVHIWDIEMATLVDCLEGHRNPVSSVAFSPSGQGLLSASLDKTIKLWELNATRIAGLNQPGLPKAGFCKTTFVGHKDYVWTTAISPEGRWVISGSNDRIVQFWNPMDGQSQFRLIGHKDSGTETSAVWRLR